MFNALLISFLAGISTMIGAMTIFFNIKDENINKFIVYSLSFSLAIMIGVSVTELLPESIINIINASGGLVSYLIIVVIVLISYIVISKFIHVIDNIPKESLYKLGLLNMFVLICHNVPEGIITFISSCNDINLGIRLAIAITLHNIPEGICIAIPIYYATKSKNRALTYSLISGLAEPFGAVITFIFLKDYITPTFLNISLLSVGVVMITISIKEIYIKVKNYNLNLYMFLGIITGIILIVLSIMLH